MRPPLHTLCSSRRAATILTPLLVVCAAGGCHRPPSRTTHTRTVAPVLSAPATHGASAGYVGVVLAPESVDVAAQLDTRIKQIRVRPGDRVERGDVLAILEVRSARNDMAMASAELSAARAERDKAKLRLQQTREQVARRATPVELTSGSVLTVSQEELASSRYQAQLTQADVASADAAVAKAKAKLSSLRQLFREGKVVAPFAGEIAARYFDTGATVRKGTALVRLVGTGAPRVRFALPEEQVDGMAAGDAVRMVVRSRTLRGTIEKVAPEVDDASRMIFCEASIDAHDAADAPLRAGEEARVTVLHAKAGGVR